MDVKIQRFVDHIPNWKENKKDENPIVVELKYLTTSEFDSCYVITPQMINTEGEQVAGGKVTVNRKKMFLYAVKKFRNFTTTDEKGEKKEIKTGQDLLDTPSLEDLFFELILFIREMESQIDTKK